MPVGIPAPGALAVTVAVNVTLWPHIDGLAFDATAVVVADLLTVCVKLLDVLAANLPSPRYCAEMVCVGTVSADVVNVAVMTPATFARTLDPSGVALSKKVT